MSKILILGDIHGKWQRVNSIVDHELSEGDLALCVGDLSNYHYQSKRDIPLYFIWGNHESYRAIEQQTKEGGLLRPIHPGLVITIGGAKIAGLSGIYSQRYSVNPDPKVNGVRKYFTLDDIEKIKSIEDKVDIFLTHEAPKGCGFVKFNEDLGKTQVNEILDALKPRKVFVGHHHMFLRTMYNGSEVIGLDYPHRSYVLLETQNWQTSRVVSKLEEGQGCFKYDWELH